MRNPLIVAALLAAGIVSVAPALAQKEYELQPDSFVRPGVAQGKVEHFVLKGSKVFPGTERDVWYYVPAGHDLAKPLALMVFQDGGGYADRNGGFRVPAVFDNLIAQGAMPATLGIMVNPGVVPATDGKTQLPRYNRSVEYDGFDGKYAAFLIQEVIPEVLRRSGARITNDPANRAISGASSGGIAAFTAAWHRPDYFGKVLGFISSFTDLRGGHGYPTLIRKTERKPLRIFLQEGVNDQDIYSGSWPIGNEDVVAALRFAGYDLRYVTGPGGHDGRQGTAVLPEALRWLWRPGGLETSGTRQPIASVVLRDNEGWRAVDGAGGVDALATLADGTLVVAGSGEVRTLGGAAMATGLGRISAVAAGPAGTVYAALPDRKQVVRLAPGPLTVVARGIKVSSIAVRHTGTLFLLEEGTGRIHWVGPNGKRTVAATGLPGAPGITLVPDQGLLLVAPDPAHGKYGQSLRIAADESLVDAQHYHDVAAPYGEPGTAAAGLAVDANGWLYVASAIGIQMLDQAGRVNGIVLSPGPGRPGPIAFAGGERNLLYAVVDGGLHVRRTKVRGVTTAEGPTKPPPPRL
ncbi:MAG: alpha/beta hydrolase-fold protein [Armatimonadota bacterium]